MPASVRSTSASRCSAASTTTPRRCGVVTSLERRYADFDGLNSDLGHAGGLGQQHNGLLTDRAGHPVERYRERGSAAAARRLHARPRPRASSHPSVEAQAGAIADDIAYDAHDIDDGLRAGVFEIGDLAHLPLLDEHPARHRREHPWLDPPPPRP